MTIDSKCPLITENFLTFIASINIFLSLTNCSHQEITKFGICSRPLLRIFGHRIEFDEDRRKENDDDDHDHHQFNSKFGKVLELELEQCEEIELIRLETKPKIRSQR